MSCGRSCRAVPATCARVCQVQTAVQGCCRSCSKQDLARPCESSPRPGTWPRRWASARSRAQRRRPGPAIGSPGHARACSPRAGDRRLDLRPRGIGAKVCAPARVRARGSSEERSVQILEQRAHLFRLFLIVRWQVVQDVFESPALMKTAVLDSLQGIPQRRSCSGRQRNSACRRTSRVNTSR